MAEYHVSLYDKSCSDLWNTFVANSNQDTLLFHRSFMAYHSHRFQDFSLMIYKNTKLVALFPANINNDELHSHQGLTFGGLVSDRFIKIRDYISCYQAILKFLSDQNISRLYLKDLPKIYIKNSTNNPLQYVLFKLNAKLTRVDLHSVVDLRHINIEKRRLRGYKKGNKNKLKLAESDDFEEFWNAILIPNLYKKHNVYPVHTLSEIRFLKSKFNLGIRQFNVIFNDKIVAGTTIFEGEHVAHCQYISGNEQNNILGSLDFLFIHLISKVFQNKRYFSFGTSNIHNGANINEGLSNWKEGFGASSIPQNFYIVDTKNYRLLDTIFI